MNHVFVLFLAFIPLSFSCKSSSWNPLNYNHPHIAALILARGGSKGIPLKNLAKLNGRSLLSINLSVVLQVNFSSVWVSTDHFKILQEAGVVNVHWRSEESARDDASSILGVLDFIHKHPEVDAVALVQCTSPFIKAEYLKQALEEIRKGKECVFSVTRSHKLRWIQRQDGSVLPLNFAIHNRPRRQDWSGELLENGMFYFAERKLINRGLLQSHRCKIVEIPQKDSLEIDTRSDLDVAKALVQLT
uniref:CMP-sialic acid synthetase n=1 Tax=Tribolium castaneum TaxID=7070 RepID=A0A2Z5TXA4_TRICA|nr:CMP-sialic acid synthetase [Tribolium castaneum]